MDGKFQIESNKSTSPFATEASGRKTEASPVKTRILSIDALRGFTMFFIIGGELIFKALYEVWPGTVTKALAENMEHATWEGFYFYDLIFPMFLFLVGMLIPVTIISRIEKGYSIRSTYLHIAKRASVLILLGLVNYGILKFDFPNMRWSSVLGRIGICYFLASIIVLHSGRITQLITIAGILIGYWAAMMFIPVPGYGAGVLTPEGALSTWIDQKIIPGKLGLGIYDRQGILSTFTALATTLIGVQAGYIMRCGRTGKRKTDLFIIAGIILLVAGWIWGRFFLISRNIWTSSFVLYTAGWSFLIMALFYWVIDVKGYKKWSTFFVVIGMNAVTIWVGQRLIDFKFTSDALILGMSKYFGIIQPLILALGIITVKWLFLYFLYRKKIFLKA